MATPFAQFLYFWGGLALLLTIDVAACASAAQVARHPEKRRPRRESIALLSPLLIVAGVVTAFLTPGVVNWAFPDHAPWGWQGFETLFLFYQLLLASSVSLIPTVGSCLITWRAITRRRSGS